MKTIADRIYEMLQGEIPTRQTVENALRATGLLENQIPDSGTVIVRIDPDYPICGELQDGA